MTTPWVQELSTNGDGTGTVEMAANHASPTEYYALGPSKVIAVRLLVYYEDTGNFTTAIFGALAGALTNGINITYEDTANGDTILETLTPAPVKKNGDWKAYAYDATAAGFGTGNEAVGVRWTFGKFSPPGLILSPTRKLVVTLDDDLSNLVTMRMVVEGHFPETV